MALTISGDSPNIASATITTLTSTTVTATTLSDGTNSTASTNAIKGSARAWVYFDGSSSTIYKSYNVSSITRNSSGNYTANFTTALSDANFSIAWSANGYGNIYSGRPNNVYPTDRQTTSTTVQVRAIDVVGDTQVSLSIFD